MKESFKLKILTPRRVVEEINITKMIVYTDAGEVTILPNHVEYLANVEISIVTLFFGENSKEYATSGGVIHFDAAKNLAVLTVNSICSAEEVDVVKLKEEEKSLEEELNNAKSIQEHKLAERNLKQVINQLSLKK